MQIIFPVVCPVVIIKARGQHSKSTDYQDWATRRKHSVVKVGFAFHEFCARPAPIAIAANQNARRLARSENFLLNYLHGSGLLMLHKL